MPCDEAGHECSVTALTIPAATGDHIPQLRDFSGPREFFHQGPSDVAKYQENQRCCDWVQTDRHQAIYGEDDRRDVDKQV